jgi:hypothetical protein
MFQWFSANRGGYKPIIILFNCKSGVPHSCAFCAQDAALSGVEGLGFHDCMRPWEFPSD